MPVTLTPRNIWTALIVEDNDDDVLWVELVMQWFQHANRSFQTIRAFNASEALRMFDQLNNIKLVIADLVMETSDAGLVLIRQLAEKQQAQGGNNNQKFAAILMTGSPELVRPLRLEGGIVSSVYDKHEQNGTKFRAHLHAALERLEQ